MGDIQSLLDRNEDLTFDRVRNLSDKTNKDSVGEKIASFATSRGGIILFGQDNDKKIAGIGMQDDDFIHRLGELAEMLDPRPTLDGPYFYDAEGKRLAVLKVISLGKGGPCCYRDTAYRRNMDRSEKIPPKELHRIWSSIGQLHFEERPSEAPLSAIDRESFDIYSNQAKTLGSFTENGFLLPRKLASKEGNLLNLTNLGIIVLASRPSDWLPNAKVHLISFKGIVPGERLGSTTFSQPLHRLITTCISYVHSFQPITERREGVRRIEEPLIPDYVIREALVNAIAHRDYEHPGEILVRIFNDRIEISNPGAPTPEEWKNILVSGIPVHRNPMIYDYLREVNLGEGAGQGIPEMKKLMAHSNLPEPIFTQINETFNIVLYNKPIEDSANSLSQQIMRVIHQERVISSTRIVEKFKISRPYALQLLDLLVSKGYLRHTGGGRTSRYEIAE